MAKITKEQLIESLKEMTLLEINDLVKGIETEFGVSAAAPVAAVAGPAVAVAAPTSVTATLVEAGAQKIAIIKLYREYTNLGLMEAKTNVEKGNVVIKDGIKPEEANDIKKKFEEAGAKVKVE
ncbi:MAG: 50S ribosomal protein L7/L12 [Mycoplasmataceae bacterium]|jgi:large subunit ribosomal protein L7/L12|nr:50S ribosomal protein L7/L12 [Mycoplasmataceae bacterium]